MRGLKPKTAVATLIGVAIATGALVTGAALVGLTARRNLQLPSGRPSVTRLPTGQLLTPTAAPDSTFVPLNPGLRDYPDFRADGAVSLAMSPDRRSLLVLTSGYNTNGDFETPDPAGSNQYVFVFDVTGVRPVQRQVIPIANTYSGIAFAPDGRHFYVSGGVDDNVYVYSRSADGWSASNRPPIELNHHALANGVLQINGRPAGEKNAALKAYV
ncbi:MAG: SMP-30/gluconolactonase/LRE family protein, partial [Gammaproteobacteria bacterium]